MKHNKQFIINQIDSITGIPKWKQRKAFIYGSQVYGTNKSYSDTDILLVSAGDLPHKEWKTDLFNIHLYTPDIFNEMLFEHHILALECMFASEEFQIFMDKDIEFILNCNKLIMKTMSLSSNSWHGAKYKINLGDYEKGLKSIWHSIRMLDFAIQIKKLGKIESFSSMNSLLKEIQDCELIKWSDINKKFLPIKKEYETKLIN